MQLLGPTRGGDSNPAHRDDPDVEMDNFSMEEEEEDEEEDEENGETRDYPEEHLGPGHGALDYDILASLDAPEDMEEMDANQGATDKDIGDGLFTPTKHVAPSGIQQKLLWAVQNRVRIELTPKNHIKRGAALVDPWLMRYLRKNNWWIQREDAHNIAAILDKGNRGLRLGKHHAAYYRSIFV